MLPVVAVDQSAGQADQAVDQPSSSAQLPSSSHPPVLSATTESEPTPVAEQITHPRSPSPEPDSEPIEHTFEQPSPEHQPLSPRQETAVPHSQDSTHPHVAEDRSMTVDDLLQLRMGVSKISSKTNKGRNLQEEGLDEMVRNMMKDKSKVFKTPTQSKTSGEEDISPTTLEAAKTLSKVASQRSKSVDKGKRYKRRKESKGKDISTGFEDIVLGLKKIALGFEEVNTGGLGFSTGSGPRLNSQNRTKEQIQQEETSRRSLRLQTLRKKELPNKSFLDALLAKRLAEEEELTEQQKQRKAQLNFEASILILKKTGIIKAKLEAKQIDKRSTKAQLKRYGEELQTEISKKQRIDNKDVSDTEEEVEVISSVSGTHQELKSLADVLFSEHLDEYLDYMHQPPGFRDSTYPDHVCLLQRSLYRLKQAPKAWHGMDTTYLLIYVDDIVLTASSQPLLQRIIASLHQEFSITDLGSINYVLGISVTRDSSGMCLPQRKYDVDVSPLLNRSLQPIKDDSQDV
ncbi:ribonuclease H-like domain-containing protein [Tanacetum coccineum]